SFTSPFTGRQTWPSRTRTRRNTSYFNRIETNRLERDWKHPAPAIKPRDKTARLVSRATQQRNAVRARQPLDLEKENLHPRPISKNRSRPFLREFRHYLKLRRPSPQNRIRVNVAPRCVLVRRHRDLEAVRREPIRVPTGNNLPPIRRRQAIDHERCRA